MIVSEVPGTTRDSVDVRFELDGKPFVAIDTPGIRRAKSRQTDIDFYGTHRAQRSIRRADVVFLFFDATQRISKVDKQLCDYIAQQYKPCVFVVNKWDQLVNTMPTGKWVRYLHDAFGTMRYAPIAFITGQTGKNVKALLNHGQMLFKQSRARVSTGQLNRMVRDAVRQNPPPPARNREPKIYYATQVGIQPPTIVLFVNDPALISKPYQRVLARQIPRRAELRRSADQALSAPPAPGRRARRHRKPRRRSRRRPTANRHDRDQSPRPTPRRLNGRSHASCCGRSASRRLPRKVRLNAQRIGRRSETARWQRSLVGLLTSASRPTARPPKRTRSTRLRRTKTASANSSE